MLLLLASISIVPAGQTFQCTPSQVWDGDRPIWCAEGPRLRLAGFAAKELDGTCKTGDPCPAPDPIQSRNAVVLLIGKPVGIAREDHVLVCGPTMICQLDGSAGGNRTVAFCVSPAVRGCIMQYGCKRMGRQVATLLAGARLQMTSELGEGSLFFSIDKLHAAVEAFSTSHLVVN